MQSDNPMDNPLLRVAKNSTLPPKQNVIKYETQTRFFHYITSHVK